MHHPRRRLASLSLAAATSLVLGTSALAAAGPAASRAAAGGDTGSGTAARQAYAERASSSKDLIGLDLLAFNDFHGNLEVVDPASSSGRINNTPAGGVAYLASLLKQERMKSRAAGARPITVAAGDLIGASPLLSAAFHDEPTIKAMNRLGLQVASVGNHEFDEGYKELRRMQRGGCLHDGDGANGQNSCPGDQHFRGADFRYLAANVEWKDPSAHARPTLFPSTKVMNVHGVKVGFIGMTLQGTPAIVSQAGIQGLRFRDEVRTAEKIVPELRAQGVESIIVLLHEGVTPADPTAYNDCTGPQGAALRIARRLPHAIDAVVSGHTHQPYNCVVRDPAGAPRLLTSAASFGRMITKLHFLINPETGDIARRASFAENKIVTNDATRTAAPALQRLIDVYKTLVAPIANQVVGHIAGTNVLPRTADADGESPLGDVIADAQKADETIVQDGEHPVVALMNPGGIRADLVENAAGDVTYEAAFTVQPFNNFLTSMDLTGAQLLDVLDQQWNGLNEQFPRILQVSGLRYTWDKSEAARKDADAIVGDVLVDADGNPGTAMVPLDPRQTYRVVANNFLADGGDNFSVLADGTDRLVGGLDIDAFRTYLLAHDPVAVPATDRISSQP
jgi:5'-nucleotidase